MLERDPKRDSAYRKNNCKKEDRELFHAMHFAVKVLIPQRPERGRFLNGRNFSGAWESRHAAFGIARRPR
jgi:hypothetical protein